MRVDIGRSRYAQLCAVGVAMLGTAAWVQIALLRGDGIVTWLTEVIGPSALRRTTAWPAALAALIPSVLAVLLLLRLVRSVARIGGVPSAAGYRRTTRLVLLGHADARVYWQTASRWRWRRARRKRAAVAGENAGAASPTSGVDEVCIVEIVQWGGFCLWLAICPRYAAPPLPLRAWPASWLPGSRRAARRWLCIPVDAVTPDRFHALCARCQAMRRGAGFLSPW